MNAIWVTTALTGAALLASVTAGMADEPFASPARARAARAAGLIKPLAVLLGSIESRYVGQVIEAELHEANGHWSYEFELLPDNGRLFRVYLDATTGAIVSTRGPVREKP